MPDTTGHQMIIQVFISSPNMFLHYLGKLKHTKLTIKWTKNAKSHPRHYW